MKYHTNNRGAEARNYYKNGTATRVVAAENSRIFHADTTCPEISDAETLRRFPLGWVVSHRSNPVHPCHYCTQDPETTAAVALAYDKIEPDDLVEPFAHHIDGADSRWARNEGGGER